MLIMQFTAVVLIVLVQILSIFCAKDATIEPKAAGRDVVDAVIFKLKRSEIFVEDRRLLVRIAYVESKFGNDPNTYRPSKLILI